MATKRERLNKVVEKYDKRFRKFTPFKAMVGITARYFALSTGGCVMLGIVPIRVLKMLDCGYDTVGTVAILGFLTTLWFLYGIWTHYPAERQKRIGEIPEIIMSGQYAAEVLDETFVRVSKKTLTVSYEKYRCYDLIQQRNMLCIDAEAPYGHQFLKTLRGEGGPQFVNKMTLNIPASAPDVEQIMSHCPRTVRREFLLVNLFPQTTGWSFLLPATDEEGVRTGFNTLCNMIACDVIEKKLMHAIKTRTPLPRTFTWADGLLEQEALLPYFNRMGIPVEMESAFVAMESMLKITEQTIAPLSIEMKGE